MKHISSIIFLVLAAIFGYAQKFQATIKPGSQANTAIVAIRPDAAFTNAKITTFYFSVGIPVSVGVKPTVVILNNFNTALSYTAEIAPQTEMIAGVEHFIYNFLSDGATAAGAERNYAVGDNNMVELAFGGAPEGTTSAIKIVSLPDGGKTLNSYFNIYNLGIDVTNEGAMFYGGTPVNSAQGYSGLSYTSVSNISLPTKFVSFFATKKDDNADLTWTVDNEENNNYFVIERSTDARTFSEIGRVNSVRNGQSSHTYNSTDLNISRLGSAAVYYRIKQVEADGNSLYSPVRQININSSNFKMALYPNPVKTNAKLVLDAPSEGKATLLIRDASGKTVQQVSLQLVKGINQKEINASMLSTGEYSVTVKSDELSQTIKMTKAN